MAAANRNGDVFPDSLIRLGATTEANPNAGRPSTEERARTLMQLLDHGIVSSASAIRHLGLPEGLPALPPSDSANAIDAAAYAASQLQAGIARDVLSRLERENAARRIPEALPLPVQAIGTPVPAAATTQAASGNFSAMQAAVASHFARQPVTVSPPTFEQQVQQEPMTRQQWEGVVTGRFPERQRGRRREERRGTLPPLSAFPRDMQDVLRELRQWLSGTDEGEELLCDMRDFRRALYEGGWDLAFQRFPEYRRAIGAMDQQKGQFGSVPESEPPAVVEEPAVPATAVPQIIEKRKRGFDG